MTPSLQRGMVPWLQRERPGFASHWLNSWGKLLGFSKIWFFSPVKQNSVPLTRIFWCLIDKIWHAGDSINFSFYPFKKGIIIPEIESFL